MAEDHERLYGILLDVQKQLGSVSRETGEQTKKLDALNEKVAVANSRTGKLELAVTDLKEWRKYILGGFAVLTVLGVYLIHTLTQDVVRQTSQQVISILEDKYDFKIND